MGAGDKGVDEGERRGGTICIATNAELCCTALPVFDPYEYRVDICNELRLADRSTNGPACVLHGKNFNVGYCTQTVQPNSFIPAMLKGTVDLYHSILFH